MQTIPLNSEPNQELTAFLDNTRYTLRIKEAAGRMAADVSIDGVLILQGVRLLAGQPVIPYAYLQRGNFIVLTADEAEPGWREVGTTQTLVYLSPEELAAL